MFIDCESGNEPPSVRRAMSVVGRLDAEYQHGPPDGGRAHLATVL